MANKQANQRQGKVKPKGHGKGDLYPIEMVRNGVNRKESPLIGRHPGNGERPKSTYLRGNR